MDLTSIIEIAVIVVVIYFFLKFIVSPVIKVIVGIIIFLVLIYLLQRFVGFNIDQILAPFGISFKSSTWGLNFNWLSNPIGYLTNQAETFFRFMWGNLPKSLNK